MYILYIHTYLQIHTHTHAHTHTHRVKELMLLNCVLEKTLESPLDCKEIKPVNSEGYQS